MAGDSRKPFGRVVRDPALADRVIGREVREGELEVSAEKVGDWSSGEKIVPSTKQARKIQSALKDTLRAQLETEAASLGDIDTVAIHGRTGISTLEGREQIR